MEVARAVGSMPCSRALRPRVKRSTGGSNALLISCDAFMCVTDAQWRLTRSILACPLMCCWEQRSR